MKKVSYYNHSAAGDGGLAEAKDRKRLTKVWGQKELASKDLRK